MAKFSVDYWGYFKYCVKDLGISPSEAWKMDLMEISHLSDSKQSDIDLTVMLNFERKLNGATSEWLTKNH